MSLYPFHLAIPVEDLEKADAFYGGLMGCERGRQSENWIDYDFFGHQLVTHLAPEECGRVGTGDVDGKKVPVKHFGVILEPETWEALAARLEEAGVDFIIEPGLRFGGAPGEQKTFFLLDPSGNALEFKCFKDMAQLFAT